MQCESKVKSSIMGIHFSKILDQFVLQARFSAVGRGQMLYPPDQLHLAFPVLGV